MAISIRLGVELEERIKNLAKLTGRTQTFYIEQMILKSIDEMEVRYYAASGIENPVKNEEIAQ